MRRLLLAVLVGMTGVWSTACGGHCTHGANGGVAGQGGASTHDAEDGGVSQGPAMSGGSGSSVAPTSGNAGGGIDGTGAEPTSGVAGEGGSGTGGLVGAGASNAVAGGAAGSHQGSAGTPIGGGTAEGEAGTEGTGQAATLLELLGRREEADATRQAIDSARLPGGGIPAASIDGLTTGFDLPDGSPWVYYRRAHVGATGWAVFACGFNPFWSVASCTPPPQ